MSVRDIRDKEAEMPENTPEVEPQAEAVDTSVLETRMEDLDRKLDRVQSLLDAPVAKATGISSVLTPFNWFRSQVEANFSNKMERREKIDEAWSELQTRAANGDLETRALADVTGGQTQAGDNGPADDLSGLVVEEFMADQIVHILNRRRPVFAAAGSFRMPRSGYATIPTVTQNTVVTHRTTQKAEAGSQKMITTNATYKAEWLSGAVDISLEVIRTAEVDVLSMVWNDLLGQYAKATELNDTAGAVEFFEDDAAGSLAGFTYSEAALDTATYAGFIDDVLLWSETVEDETDSPATKLVVTRAQFRAIAGFVDANDRRLFSVLGPTNADATAGLNAQRIQLPDGPTVIKARSADLTAALLFNEEAFKAADGGPERVEALNVGLMGHDLGLLGRTMLVPRIPAGIVRFTTTPV